MKLFLCIPTVALVFAVAPAWGSNLLINGDFSAPPILGPGQVDVTLNEHKQIQPNPLGVNYEHSVSGIVGWTSATPEIYGSDNGPLLTTGFGNPTGQRMVFIENWNRVMSQTVDPGPLLGKTAIAQIQFGTLGSDFDRGRAGTFYLVAGSVNPSNPDLFQPGSLILDSVVVGNPSWNARAPAPTPVASVLVGNGVLTSLELTHRFGPGDPALGMPLTVAFRTEWSSVGQTAWNRASLNIIATVPEAGFCGTAMGFLLLGWGGLRWWRSATSDKAPFPNRNV